MIEFILEVLFIILVAVYFGFIAALVYVVICVALSVLFERKFGSKN